MQHFIRCTPRYGTDVYWTSGTRHGYHEKPLTNKQQGGRDSGKYYMSKEGMFHHLYCEDLDVELYFQIY